MADAEASGAFTVVGLAGASWGRLTLALTLAGIVAFSGWSCDDLRFRPLTQESPAVESGAAGQAAGSAEKKVPDLGEEFERRIVERFGYLLSLAK